MTTEAGGRKGKVADITTLCFNMKTYVWLLLMHTLAVQELVTAEEDEGLVDRESSQLR